MRLTGEYTFVISASDMPVATGDAGGEWVKRGPERDTHGVSHDSRARRKLMQMVLDLTVCQEE
jgi:hypothetical protein